MNAIAGQHTPAEPFITHDGLVYLEAMGLLAKLIDAKTYLEIGTGHGHSLAKVECATVAVDPKFQFSAEALEGKPTCFLFQMASDAFFREYCLGDYFKRGVDLAFLDGLHRFEYLLRDFYNTEVWCRRGSVILLHDCLPRTAQMSSREKVPGEWAGDVWKIIPALRKYRPELKFLYLDCPPTGLVAVTNLDPGSTVLKDRYFDIVEEFVNIEADAVLPSLYASISITDSRELANPEQASRYFGM